MTKLHKLLTLLTAVVLLFGLYQCANVDDAKLPNGMTSLSIDAPFKDVSPASNQLIVENPAEATDFELPSGTAIHIPANALVDQNGQPVTGPVTIEFSEFHNAAQIIASGIPMRVLDENNDEDWMQTAGMFDIRANQDGQPVQIAEGKTVEVGLRSEVEGPYDFWLYDETANNWINQGNENTPTEISASPEELAAEIEELKTATAKPPVKPDTDGKNNIAIGSHDLKLINCPELKGKDPVVLTYAGKDPAKAPEAKEWVFKDDMWYSMELEKKGNNYQLTLIGDSLYQIPVQLAPTEADLEAAMARYEANLAKHQNNLTLLRNKEALRAQQQAFYRRVAEVPNFGLYNYDILWKTPSAVRILADFNFGEENEMFKETVTVYLITGDGRVVVGLPSYDWSRMRIDTEADNKMLAVLPNNQVALFTQSDFNNQMDEIKEASGEDFTFNMQVEEQAVTSMQDLQDLIDKASS